MLALASQKTRFYPPIFATNIRALSIVALILFCGLVPSAVFFLGISSAAAQALDGAQEPVAEEEEPTFAEALGAAAFGAGLIGWRVYRKRRRLAARAWPETEGDIISNDVEEVDVSGSDDYSADYKYYPRIRYRYSADGRVRESTQIGIDEPRFDVRSAAERYLLENFAVGSRVSVLFNPNKPADALLVRPDEKLGKVWQALHWAVIAFGAIIFLGGVILLVDLLF